MFDGLLRTLLRGPYFLTQTLLPLLADGGAIVNVTSNAASFAGSTRTRIGGDAFARHPEVIPALAARTALGRLGEPDDIGLVIASLLGDEGRWITAQDIEVSGGYNL